MHNPFLHLLLSQGLTPSSLPPPPIHVPPQSVTTEPSTEKTDQVSLVDILAHMGMYVCVGVA